MLIFYWVCEWHNYTFNVPLTNNFITLFTHTHFDFLLCCWPSSFRSFSCWILFHISTSGGLQGLWHYSCLHDVCKSWILSDLKWLREFFSSCKLSLVNVCVQSGQVKVMVCTEHKFRGKQSIYKTLQSLLVFYFKVKTWGVVHCGTDLNNGTKLMNT